MLLIVVIVGFLTTKAGMFSKKTRADITDLVIYIIMPCNIFSAFHKGVSPETLRQFVIILLVAFGMQLMYMVLNKLLYIKMTPERRLVMQFATIGNNAAFMGLPVIGAVFGQTGLLYGSIALIPLRIFMWTAGLSLFTKTDTKRKVKVLVTHPCIWSVILGVVYLFVPFELPDFLSNTIAMVGDCVTVLTMLAVGSILSEVDPKTILNKDSIYCLYYSFFRLIAIPAVIFGALRLLRLDPLVIGVVVLSSSMPAAVMTAMLSEKYDKDSVFGSKIVFVSTILSMITLPIIAEVLTRVLML